MPADLFLPLSTPLPTSSHTQVTLPVGADLPTSSSSTTFAIGSLSLAEGHEVPASATGTDPLEGLGMPPASKRPRGISGAGAAELKGKPRLRGVAQVTAYTPVEERKSQAPDSSSVLRSTRQSTHLNGASKAPVERRSKVRYPFIVGDRLELSYLHLIFCRPFPNAARCRNLPPPQPPTPRSRTRSCRLHPHQSTCLAQVLPCRVISRSTLPLRPSFWRSTTGSLAS